VGGVEEFHIDIVAIDASCQFDSHGRARPACALETGLGADSLEGEFLEFDFLVSRVKDSEVFQRSQGADVADPIASEIKVA
jgi:hypothetical protein